VPQHGAQRRDTGASGDEEKAAYVGTRGKRERTERPLDVDQRPNDETRRLDRIAATSSSSMRSRRASSGAEAIE